MHIKRSRGKVRENDPFPSPSTGRVGHRTSDLLELAVRYAEQREAIRAQHGPVLILMRDGKPVEPVGGDTAVRDRPGEVTPQ